MVLSPFVDDDVPGVPVMVEVSTFLVEVDRVVGVLVELELDVRSEVDVVSEGLLVELDMRVEVDDTLVEVVELRVDVDCSLFELDIRAEVEVSLLVVEV
jgi:hypothetical protein